MLSRVADTIYWMSRYIERAENYARFMDVNYNLTLEMPAHLNEQWKPLVETTGDWPLYVSLHGEGKKKKIIYFLGFDPENPNSIYNCICKARENARAIRPEITKEVWTQINRIYYRVKEGQEKKEWEKKDPRNYFFEIKEGCQLLNGTFDSTISRTEAWHFYKLGQFIERADKTSRVLDVKYHMLLPEIEAVGSTLDLIQWSALLKSVSAYDMYLKKYGKLTSQNICEFLILDKTFPRSILSCIINASLSLSRITGNMEGYSNAADKQVGILKSQLEFADVDEILQAGLHEYLDDIQMKLNNLSTDIFETFFSKQNIMSNSQQQSQ